MPCLTDVPGLHLGHAQDYQAVTGLSVILFPHGATGGMSSRGGSTSTRQVGGLTPGHSVTAVHGVVFSGGSAFGLSSADGVLSWLEERDIGFDVGVAKVPIVPCAALFDLRLGRADIRPDAAMARAACDAASTEPSTQGSIGAGCGATVGKLYGLDQAMKGGLGTSSLSGPDGLIVGGLVAVNCFGDVRHPDNGRIIAGARTAPDSHNFADAEASIIAGQGNHMAFRNTTLALVATNARLTRSACISVAGLAEMGLGRAIRPYATRFDGDLVFCVSPITDDDSPPTADIHTIGLMAAKVLQQATLNAVNNADGFGLVPAVRDLG